MLAEWFKHLATACPPHLKAMGYLRELIAIEARHRRCRRAWAPHLAHCRRLILKAAEGIGHKRVTVLGSGLLLDVPVDELAALFDEVVLVDVFHMPAVEKRLRGRANVRLLAQDMSGLIEATYRHVNEGRGGPLPPPQADAGPLASSDLVVSANVLTQLPLMPVAWVREKGRGYDEPATKAFARRIVEHHLDLLAALPGRVCLLTETKRMVVDGPDVLHDIDPLFGAAFPYRGRQWTWDIAPRPELSRRYDLRFRMTGISDLDAARP
ncbi:MAG TPA: hypothetical protein VGA19_11235 [Rhodospirillales bacterium]